MAFWSTEKFKQILAREKIVDPVNESAIKHGAYELSLGSEAFLTSNDKNKKQTLAEGEQLVIPPGQFGLLLTDEKISVPKNAIGFISIKAGIKFRGLVNVSGFHVDPGFSGKLKFSVYNAGSQNIILAHKQRVFLLWFSDLDRETADTYSGSHAEQDGISPDDVMRMQGEIASPGQLRKEMHELENKVRIIQWMLGVLVTAVASFLIRGYLQSGFAPPQTPQTPHMPPPAVVITNSVPGQQTPP